jgi:hypothetical protein
MTQAFRSGPNGSDLQFSANADEEVNNAPAITAMILDDAVMVMPPKMITTDRGASATSSSCKK